MGQVDLHIHTTASDGRKSPADIVRLAAEGGLRFIAITDHDSVEGIAPALAAARDFPPLEVIPGVEMSTDVPEGEVHILGYFIDYRRPKLLDTLKGLRASREVRAQKMVRKLDGMGIHIKWQRVRELAGGGSVGRPHIAQAMLEGGYVSSIPDAFARYIGRDGPAYAEREKTTPRESVQLIARMDGLAVLAHPAGIDNLEELLDELKEEGLAGIEAYYNGYPPETVERLLGLACKYDLIPSGGSDYHGFGGEGETPIGGSGVPLESAERLIALAGARAAGSWRTI